MKKKDQEIVNDYLIDYDMFSVEEIVKIISFMKLVEDTKRKKVSKELLKTKYNEYRTILNNKALEKQYDKMLLKKSNVSIYETMKKFGYTRQDEFGNTYYTKDAYRFGQSIFAHMRLVMDKFIKDNNKVAVNTVVPKTEFWIEE